ncbi:luciferin 4-monooxygenase-like [Colias croceus]|uniref:luciferin 4-monooxygenase-like n=1 Tax=Colias crocea TaxID=72248 RepID=UPI001E27F905|nr:luciferin 4-monooxygenase-like [Colias croceus]
MDKYRGISDAIQWYISKIQAETVAQSGIPSDRYHLGKLTLDALKDVPDKVLQIDGATGETETFGSVLTRSVKCANAMRKVGVKHKDVILLMGPNHIDLTIPMYAAFYLGAGVAGIDMYLGTKELKDTFSINRPKIIFCQSERAHDVEEALTGLDLGCEVITFDSGSKFKSLSEFLDVYGKGTSVEDFKASNFDPAETPLMLIATSGTTGVPKSAVVTHKNLLIGIQYMWANFTTFPAPTRLVAVLSPIQWYSAIFKYISTPILRQTRLQSSLPMTQEHAYHLINKYKPSYAMSSPNFWVILFKPGDREKCDLTCFDVLIAGGSPLQEGLRKEIKKATPNTLILNVYGMSEISGLAMVYDENIPHSLGRPIPSLTHKLVNPETLEEITKPHVTGELWVKGPSIFKGYYNNPEVTSQTLTEDGWLRTGDTMYRDEKWYFYFVDRLKLLLKYKNHQISPVEIEAVISKHPGVFEVAVTGIRNTAEGDLPVACVVPHDGYNITAQEIKDLVKKNLTDSKQLRGGVIFVKKLPMTSTSKIDRPRLEKLAKESVRE